MDETDYAMQAELASQAGSIVHSDKMELEHEDQQTVRDAEMEIHDIEAEGTIDDMTAAIREDAEMNAEMLEQEHVQAERDWKDVGAEVEVLPLDDAPVEHTDSTEVHQIDAPESTDVQPFEQLEDPASPGNGITDSETVPPKATAQAEAEQQTLAQDLGLSTGAGEPTQVSEEHEAEILNTQPDTEHSEKHIEPEASTNAQEGAVTIGGLDDRDQFANAADAPEYDYNEIYEPVASTSAIVIEDYAPAPAAFGFSGYRRPALQKDYLAHVEVFSGAPPLLRDGSNGLAAPHVSLIYNNDAFSLFRPSSVPSGDDEKVIFESDEDQQLYYSSLDTLTGKLHEAFPHFRGDGDNELILDFGILDMQISEDNVYTQQLSLHDIDKIRVGMSQPELDRLQVTLLIGKRFVYKFNELAEHVYRMHAGSEYDSGTVYDETVEEEEGVEEEIPEYYDEGAAQEEAYAQEEETHAVVTGHDLVHGTAAEQATGAEEIAIPTGEVTEEADEEPIEYPEDEEEAESGPQAPEIDAGATEEQDPTGALQEVHPPSDEYYEDPEFSQHPAEAEEEPYEEQYDDQEEGVEDDSDTVQDYTELEFANGAEQETEQSEAELTIDPNAPLDEVVELIEDFEEGTLEGEDDLAAESKAARHDEPIVSTTSVNVEAVDKDTERIYAGMDSLAAEEEGAVDAHTEPTSVISPALPVSKANGTGKREREEEEESMRLPPVNGNGVEATQTHDHSKKLRVGDDA